MGIERYSQSIPASGRLEIPTGNYFSLFSASAALNIRFQRRGNSEGFNGVSSGIQIERVNPWEFVVVTGTAGTSVVWYHGTIDVQEDKTLLFLAATVIAGTVSTNEQPASALSDTAPVTAANGAVTQLIAANLSRKRVRIFSDSANVDGGTATTHAYLVNAAAGGQLLAELVPGLWHEIKNTAALYVDNKTGTAHKFYIMEET